MFGLPPCEQVVTSVPSMLRFTPVRVEPQSRNVELPLLVEDLAGRGLNSS
jgi:hypothetical protein